MTVLTPVSEALSLILDTVQVVDETQECPLNEALGRVMAVDVVSPLAVPGDDNSAMDGFALRAKDAGTSLPVSQRIAAGTTGEPLEPGTAARIFTGAPVPPGADAVVMQENCQIDGGYVYIPAPVNVGQHIRPQGQDIAEGEVVLSAGRRLKPQDLGLMASVGLATACVRRQVKVAVFSTGSELIEPGAAALKPGQVYNSNRFVLTGLLNSLGCEVIDMGVVADDPQQTEIALLEAARQSDCVITSGGVSVGEEDHVKAQVEKLGQLHLWKLAIKPGKPLAYGSIGDTPFFGLPGNPSSVLVTFCVVARPWLLATQGACDIQPSTFTVRADFEVSKPGLRQEYRRVTLLRELGDMLAREAGNQSSGALSAAGRAHALAVIPANQVVKSGDLVEVILLSELGC